MENLNGDGRNVEIISIEDEDDEPLAVHRELQSRSVRVEVKCKSAVNTNSGSGYIYAHFFDSNKNFLDKAVFYNNDVDGCGVTVAAKKKRSAWTSAISDDWEYLVMKSPFNYWKMDYVWVEKYNSGYNKKFGVDGGGAWELGTSTNSQARCLEFQRTSGDAYKLNDAYCDTLEWCKTNECDVNAAGECINRMNGRPTCGNGCKAPWEGNGHVCDCPSGHKRLSATDCRKCPAGTFQNQSNQKNCINCGPGKFSDDGESSCHECSAGTFTDSSGGKNVGGCQSCPAGTYSEKSSDSCTACKEKTDSDRGFYSQMGKTACEECPEGTTVNDDKSGCEDINECEPESGSHPCPKDSSCVNFKKSEPGGNGDITEGDGYQCQCNNGFAVRGTNGMRDYGNSDIECESRDVTILYDSVSYDTISGVVLQMTSFTQSQLTGEYDLNIGKYVLGGNTLPDVGSIVNQKIKELKKAKIFSTDIEPGTAYMLWLTSHGGNSKITSKVLETTCECIRGGTDQPTGLTISQRRGLVTFAFKDQSRCENGYSMTRKIDENGEVDAISPTYFHTSIDTCGEEMMPGEQYADNLFRSKLPVGSHQTYFVQAVGPGNSLGRYVGTSASMRHQVAWEASIDGIVTLPKYAGSIPVQNVEVSWELHGPNGVIEFGTITTGPSGRYFIEMKSEDEDLYTDVDTGIDRDFEVRITYFKRTNEMVHTFMCQDEEFLCSNERYTSVYLKHLDFDIEHSAHDMSSKALSGSVKIDDANGCPIVGAEVCIEISGQNGVLQSRSCVDSDGNGDFSLGAPIESRVTILVEYHRHTFELSELEDHEIERVADGFKIKEPIHVDGDYTGFNFMDVQEAQLATHIFGGLCERGLGTAKVLITIPNCPSWDGVELTQNQIFSVHAVPAHELVVQVDIDDRPDISIPRQRIDLKDATVEDNNSATRPRRLMPVTEDSPTNEDDTDVEDSQSLTNVYGDAIGGEMLSFEEDNEIANSLTFRYDGITKIIVEVSNDGASASCDDKQKEGESFHVLPAYFSFDLIVKVRKHFGTNIEDCDILPDDTQVKIESFVGIDSTAGTEDPFVINLDEETLERYSRCRNGCSFPIQHIQEDTQSPIAPVSAPTSSPTGQARPPAPGLASSKEISNAHVATKLYAGPPNIAGDYTKNILVSVDGVGHVARILLFGDYDTGVPDIYPLPAMAPIMIIRDPPGSSSYAYYENVKTTTLIRQRASEFYLGFDSVKEMETGLEGTQNLCIGLGAITCITTGYADTGVTVKNEFGSKRMINFQDETTETSFATTWSYTTSDQAQGAGHAQDIFVVPSIALSIYSVIEVSFNQAECKGEKTPKLKSAVNPRKDNSIAFLSLQGLEEEIGLMNETRGLLVEKLENNQTTAFQTALDNIDEALANWDRYLADYEEVNDFGTELVNPGKWLQTLKRDCSNKKWGPSILCSTDIDTHWSSLLPSQLSMTAEELNLEEWEDVHMISFSGGGGELKFKLDKTYSENIKSMDGVNHYIKDRLGVKATAEFNAFYYKHKYQLDFAAGFDTTKVALKNDFSADDCTVGFVLQDPDAGDSFDVKVAIDPTYGSFVFQTVGKLPHFIISLFSNQTMLFSLTNTSYLRWLFKMSLRGRH